MPWVPRQIKYNCGHKRNYYLILIQRLDLYPWDKSPNRISMDVGFWWRSLQKVRPFWTDLYKRDGSLGLVSKQYTPFPRLRQRRRNLRSFPIVGTYTNMLGVRITHIQIYHLVSESGTMRSISSDLGKGIWIAVNLDFIPRPWFSPTTCYGGKGDFSFLLSSTKIEVDKCCLSFSARDINKGGRKHTFAVHIDEYKKWGLSFSAKQTKKESTNFVALTSHNEQKIERVSLSFVLPQSAHLQKAKVKTRQGYCSASGHASQRVKNFALLLSGFPSGWVKPDPTQPDLTQQKVLQSADARGHRQPSRGWRWRQHHRKGQKKGWHRRHL